MMCKGKPGIIKVQRVSNDQNRFRSASETRIFSSIIPGIKQVGNPVFDHAQRAHVGDREKLLQNPMMLKCQR